MDFASFKKIEGSPTSARTVIGAGGSDMVEVVVRLRKGAVIPAYITARAAFGSEMFSATAKPDQISRLDADPAVESIALGRALQRIE